MWFASARRLLLREHLHQFYLAFCQSLLSRSRSLLDHATKQARVREELGLLFFAKTKRASVAGRNLKVENK